MTDSDRTSLVDIHSHLVPGVDDGARSVEAAVASVQRMSDAGIRRIITTPHIRGSLTVDAEGLEERLSTVSTAFEKVASAVRAALPHVEFRRGHEVLLDVPEVNLADPRIRLAGTSFVLVEWPRLQIPPSSVRVLARLHDQGYRPIVAHPERYMGHVSPLDMADRWREAGAYLQVNYGSLVGRYGSEANDIALQLLEMGLVDYMASDFHGQSGLKLYQKEAWDALGERGAHEALDVMCRINPGRILDDLEPLTVTALAPPPKLFDRIRGMMRRHMRPER